MIMMESSKDSPFLLNDFGYLKIRSFESPQHSQHYKEYKALSVFEIVKIKFEVLSGKAGTVISWTEKVCVS